MRPTFVVRSLALLAAIALAPACRTPPARPPSETLTEAAVAPLAGGGEPTPLHAISAGRPMVVDLYATWCQSCRKQIAGLEQLATEHGDDLVVVGVDVGEELDVASQFAAREGIDYQTFGDPEFQFADSMGVSQLPALLLVDQDGAIVHRSSHLDDEMRAKIQALVDRRVSER